MPFPMDGFPSDKSFFVACAALKRLKVKVKEDVKGNRSKEKFET